MYISAPVLEVVLVPVGHPQVGHQAVDLRGPAVDPRDPAVAAAGVAAQAPSVVRADRGRARRRKERKTGKGGRERVGQGECGEKNKMVNDRS